MKRSIAFTGKGGVGKTTCLVLFLKFLIETRQDHRILVIDADPDANVGDLIGEEIYFKDTIAGRMKILQGKIAKNIIAPYSNSKQAIEAELFNCILHKNNFDFIEMGRTEGVGCYCSVNNVLKNALDIISEDYDFVLFDSPAGLEHFARKTGKDVSDLLIIVEPSKMAFSTLKNILIVSDDVKLKFDNYWVLGNKFLDDRKDFFRKKIESLNEARIQLLGFISQDPEIMRYNLLSNNLLDLPRDNLTYKSAKELFEKLM